MLKFNENDVPVLDFILKTISEPGGFVTPELLEKEGYLISDGKYIAENGYDFGIHNDFNRYVYILFSYDCASYSNGMTSILVSNSKTLFFFKNGGFKKVFKDLTNERKQKDINKEKEIHDAKLSKWKVKTFWYIFLFALIGFVLSGYNFINSRISSKDSILLKERLDGMEIQLQELHLKKNNQDSLQDAKQKKKTYKKQVQSDF